MAAKSVKRIDKIEGETKQNLCQPCSRKKTENIANVLCLDCDEYQCNECVKGHQLYPIMAKHKVVNAEDKEFLHGRYKMKGLDKCKLHGKTIKFLCEDDETLCCSNCAIGIHRKCQSVVEIQEKANKEKPELAKFKQDLLNIDSTTKEFFLRVKETQEKLAAGEAELVNKIQDMQDKVNEMFEELKKKVSCDTVKFKNQTMKELNANETSCSKFTSEVKLHLSEIEEATRKGTQTQQLIMSYYLRDRIQKIQESAKQEIEQFKDIRMNFDFDIFLKLPPQKTEMPGRLTLDTVTDKPPDLQDKKMNLKLLASIDLKQEDNDVEERFYTGIDFLQDGRLVAMDNKNKKCFVYSESAEPVGSYELCYYPVDVVSVSEDVVAVTSSNEDKIDLFEIQENNDISLKETIKVTSEYSSICLLDHSNFVVGTVDETKPVRVVSIDGEEKEFGITCPPKTYPIDQSACTYLQNHKKVVFSDRFAHTVYIDDIVSNTRVEVKDEKLIKEPRGLAVGPGDSIFVCNMQSNSLVQISHTVEILSSHELNMIMPSSICVSKDYTKLAVSNCADDHHKLQLYEIEWNTPAS